MFLLLYMQRTYVLLGLKVHTISLRETVFNRQKHDSKWTNMLLLFLKENVWFLFLLKLHTYLICYSVHVWKPFKKWNFTCNCFPLCSKARISLLALSLTPCCQILWQFLMKNKKWDKIAGRLFARAKHIPLLIFGDDWLDLRKNAEIVRLFPS